MQTPRSPRSPTTPTRSDAARYADDVASFIADCVRIDNAQPGDDDAPESIPFDLWEAQRDLLGDIEREPRLLILKARQLGISWLVCAYALWLCLHRGGRLVLFFSIGQDEANEMMRRVNVMYGRLPADVRAALPAPVKDNTEAMRWANGSAIQSLPSRVTAGSGYTASLIVLDEFAKNPNAAALYTAVKPTIDGGGKMIVLSTAHGTGNLYHDLVARAQAGTGRFAFRFLPWHARPGRDAAWHAQVSADAVDDAHMHQEYPAAPDEAFEASEADSFLSSIALWDACIDTLPPLDAHTPCVLALDAAESNDTFGTVIISAHPRDPARPAVRYVRPYVPTRGQVLDFDEIEIDVRELVQRYAIQQLVYDPMLLGQTVRRLRQPARLARRAMPDRLVDYPPLPVEFVPFAQGVARLEADKGLYDLITQRRIAHDGSPELRAHLANANRKVDGDGRRLRIVKRQHALKIDLAVATSMGCHAWQPRAAATLPVVAGTRPAVAAYRPR